MVPQFLIKTAGLLVAEENGNYLTGTTGSINVVLVQPGTQEFCHGQTMPGPPWLAHNDVERLRMAGRQHSRGSRAEQHWPHTRTETADYVLTAGDNAAMAAKGLAQTDGPEVHA